MFNLHQWITWQPVQFEGEPKPRKIPCGGNDAHNPVNWMPLEAAQAISTTIGFVLTEADPYFCIDIDHARSADPNNPEQWGPWSQLATSVCALFPGAYIEVSYTGDGLHIFAQGVKPEGFKTKNSPLGLEVYDNKRFIAVTRAGSSGTPDINHQFALTAFVTAYMEQSIQANPVNWTNGPRADWNGPIDDDELIAKFLAMRPTADQLWNGKATLKDLWECNVAALNVSYDDGNGSYDDSQADLALASHLAFWTGCDCARIERLMWRSGLVRPKWTEHRSYLSERTIAKAAGSCQNVYSDPKAQQTHVMEPMPPQGQGQGQQQTFEAAPGQIRQGLQYLTPDAQFDHFKGCVYIIKTHTILRPNGTQVSPEQFKVIYGGYDFAMDTENHKSTKCAWEAFSKSRAVKFPIVESILFRPELEPGVIIEHEGMPCVNSYHPVPIRRIEGDITPFMDLLYKLFPDDRDRSIILAYMAACVQHIGTKFQWSPLVQGVEGNGKSFLMEAIIQSVGSRLSHSVNPKDVGNVFNAWIEGKVFVGIEEVHVSDKRDLIDALKILITNRRVEIQAKGGNQYMGDNCANFFMNTNYQDAIKKTKNDRRYAPFFTPQQTYDDILRCGMGGDYFPTLYAWARADGYAIIANYLNTYQIPDELNPATKLHRAPETSSTVNAIQASQGPVEQEIENAIEEGLQGFRGGWVSSIKLNELLQQTGKARMIPRNRRTDMMETMGYTNTGRSSMQIIQEKGRPMLYVKQGTPTITGDLAFDYMNAQGYMIP